jgi:hypothetical protein
MTIYGWDASHYDAVPNGARVVSEGFSFMTHKGGGDANDAELGAWWNAVKAQRGKLLLGAYWVLYPGNPTGRADAFLARLDSQCPGWRDGPFILQLDCEDWTGNGSTKPGKADIKAACARLKAKMPKLTPIVYASAGQYGDSLSGLGYPLWNARYVLSNQTGTAAGLYARAGGDGGKAWAVYSGQTPAIWQYTSSATIVGQTTCDANAFRGSLIELTKLVAPGWAQTVKETDVELTDKYGDAAYAGRTVQNRLKDSAMTRDLLCEAPSGTGYKVADKAIPATAGIRQLLALPATVKALSATVVAIGQQVGTSTAQLQAAIDQVDDQVVAQLTDESRSTDETAQLLVSLFGDRAQAIARAILDAPAA